MQTISISRFKATCLALLEQVRRTGEPILVTKRGEPIAQVVPLAPRPSGYGAMRGTAQELGDIVEPIGTVEWEALER